MLNAEIYCYLLNVFESIELQSQSELDAIR